MSINETLPSSGGLPCTPGERYIQDGDQFEMYVSQMKMVDLPYPDPLPDWELALKVLFYIPPFTIDIVGNIMVLLIVILNKRMRTTTNILILNLSIADIFVALFCMWIHLGKNITTEWLFGSFLCLFNFFLQVVVVTSSVLTMTIISIERFIAIVFPLRRKLSRTMVLVAITCSWLISVGTAVPYLFVMKESVYEFKNRKQITCVEVWPEYYTNTCELDKPGKKTYYTIVVIVMYFVPVIVMIVTYTVIVIKLVFKKAPGGGRASEANERKRRKVIAMLIAILVSFVLCWTPQQYLLIWDTYIKMSPTKINEKDTLAFKYIALYLAYSNSALNPIMYAGFNENFRRGFLDVFRCALWRQRNRVQSDMMNSNVQGTETRPAGNRIRIPTKSTAETCVTDNNAMLIAATSSSRNQLQ